jgi:CRP-like cAMP-binding protein
MSVTPAESQILQTTSLFREITKDEIEEILRVSRVRKVLDGEYYFLEDDPAEISYVLLGGKVKLTQVTPDGKQIILGYLIPGRVFGIIALLKKVAYPVSAQAVGACKALAWDQKTMNRLMEQYPRIALNAMRIMSGQIREFQNQVRDLSTKRVETRIARAILRLARQSGKKIDEGVLIDLPLSRQDLAEMTGSTLYTVSRVLKDWENQDLILSKRQMVIIKFPHGLVEIAEDLPSPDEGGLYPRVEDRCDL